MDRDALTKPDEVIREQVFACSPVITGGVPSRMSYAKIKEVKSSFSGRTHYLIENRSGDSIYLDHDALINLKLVLNEFVNEEMVGW